MISAMGNLMVIKWEKSLKRMPISGSRKQTGFWICCLCTNRPGLCLSYNTIVTHLPLEKYNTLSLYVIFINQSHMFEKRIENDSKPTYGHGKIILNAPRDKSRIPTQQKKTFQGKKNLRIKMYVTPLMWNMTVLSLPNILKIKKNL